MPKSEPLFWIVREHDGKRSVFLQRAGDSLFAQMRSALAGHEGGIPVEVHKLDAKTARKVPKKMIGRKLALSEARALLEKIG